MMDLIKKNIIYSNRRKTSRFNIKAEGKILFKKNEDIIEELININDISYQGIQIIFSNDDFLFNFLEAVENSNINLKIQFEYNEKSYIFNTKILWIRIFNFGEKNFHTLTALNFINIEEINSILLELLIEIQMEKTLIPQTNL